ncbi:pyridoxamine 5'-phosphate oxidase family protein [Sphingomonas sp.]|uniref:pyridoxamine 5'-phosphate oxidase family protein n=1 Tax=Sphingomonas sp. TaxID=28214 RepID=UPI001B1B5B8E|nr:pyridoxamine 5'-phosphate oxidase family protein [Sphingomonas sp.]MBO9711388.1 pyridoxamine 5'-phosphate oxidase family protein [Sphingomonas sp.]
MTDVREVTERMWKKMAASPFLMVKLDGSDDHAQPMTANLDDEVEGKFWFYTQKDNRLARGGPAMAQYVSKDHKIFACISGTLVEETDPAVIDRYWSNMTEAWFKGGRNDPNLMMLRFELRDAEIWEGDESALGFFKMLVGAKIDGSEVGRHVETAL